MIRVVQYVPLHVAWFPFPPLSVGNMTDPNTYVNDDNRSINERQMMIFPATCDTVSLDEFVEVARLLDGFD